MIICCPACNTRYVVPDTAIGVEGRTVRCAKCRHSWFQDGPAVEAAPRPAPVAAPAAQAPVAPRAAPVAAPPPAPEPQVSREPEPEPAEPIPNRAAYLEDEPEPAVPPPVYAASDAPSPRGFGGDEEGSQFDFEPPFRPRRNTARLKMIAAAIFAVVALGLAGAVGWYGMPSWVPFASTRFAGAPPGLVLDFPPSRQDRRTLPNGSKFFGVSGKVTNVGGTRKAVPTILVLLRDSRNRVVYTWELNPPKRTLNPGETITINEAMTDVPASAKVAEIGWKPD